MIELKDPPETVPFAQISKAAGSGVWCWGDFARGALQGLDEIRSGVLCLKPRAGLQHTRPCQCHFGGLGSTPIVLWSTSGIQTNCCVYLGSAPHVGLDLDGDPRDNDSYCRQLKGQPPVSESACTP